MAVSGGGLIGFHAPFSQQRLQADTQEWAGRHHKWQKKCSIPRSLTPRGLRLVWCGDGGGIKEIQALRVPKALKIVSHVTGAATVDERLRMLRASLIDTRRHLVRATTLLRFLDAIRSNAFHDWPRILCSSSSSIFLDLSNPPTISR